MSDNFDPFAFGRQADDGAELRPDEKELLQAYHALTPENAATALRVLVALDYDPNERPAEPERIKPAKPGLNQADRDRLRAACEELAAEYRAPLPEGDAGLIAVIARGRELQPRQRRS